MHCRDCKFWDKEDVFVTNETHSQFGECKITRSDDGEPGEAATLAFARDTEAYHAALMTSPDFGCVMFKAKELVQINGLAVNKD